MNVNSRQFREVGIVAALISQMRTRRHGVRVKSTAVEVTQLLGDGAELPEATRLQAMLSVAPKASLWTRGDVGDPLRGPGGHM